MMSGLLGGLFLDGFDLLFYGGDILVQLVHPDPVVDHPVRPKTFGFFSLGGKLFLQCGNLFLFLCLGLLLGLLGGFFLGGLGLSLFFLLLGLL
jgi:hypothetical protein